MSPHSREGLNDPRVTAANLSYRDITQAIAILDNRLMGIKLHGEKTVVAAPAKTTAPEKTIDKSIDEYLLDFKGETKTAYSAALQGFSRYLTGIAPGQVVEGGFMKKTEVSELTLDDLEGFYGYMSREAPNRKSSTLGLSATTSRGRFNNLKPWLRSADREDLLVKGVIRKIKVQKNDAPDTSPYSPEALERLFAASQTQDDTELFEFFVGTGMRSGEVAHSHFSDLEPFRNQAGGFLGVKKKPGHKWTPKTLGSTRKIPLPVKLWDMLQGRKRRMQTELLHLRKGKLSDEGVARKKLLESGLIFPTPSKDSRGSFVCVRPSIRLTR